MECGWLTARVRCRSDPCSHQHALAQQALERSVQLNPLNSSVWSVAPSHPTPPPPTRRGSHACACSYRAPHRSDLGDLFLANNKSDEAADCYRHRNKLDGGNANGARLPLAPQAREVAPTQPTAAARQQQYQQQWVSSSSGAPAGTQPRAKKAQSSAGTAAGRPRGIARPPPALPTASDSAPATTSSSAPAAGAAAGVPAAVKRGPGRPRKHPLPST